jgi:5-aminopentanamidase
VSAVQNDPKIGEFQDNLLKITEMIEQVAHQGAKLIVFPECATSGYIYDSFEEALKCADEVPGKTTDSISKLTQVHNIYVIIGILEKSNHKLYNTAILIGPRGIIGTYRKNHLPYLGVDRFVTPGNEQGKVFDTGVGRIGMAICYDLRFPESARTLALEQADIICQPSNWPVEAKDLPDFLTRARAYENRVYVIAVNRGGIERDIQFIGRSQIIDPRGSILKELPTEDTGFIVAELDIEVSRRKKVVNKPGEYEVDLFNDRRPNLYRVIVE